MNSSPDWSAQLGAATDAYKLLVQLLQDEQRCLTHDQPDVLTGLLAEKQKAALAADTAGNALNSAFASLGLENGPAIAEWLSANRPGLLPSWQQLLEQVRQAALLNQCNGKLIESRRQALDTLVYTLAAGQSDALGYSQQGQLQGGVNRHIADKA
ncbi:flagellar protein FlgN [Jeongeupia wiesaeckerbachi]|uniref:flagella synthesis protein FlgN n=1 Tax=Jeongeupia wiesaeckerbachi TaxID=3051218 RepID=UPI003D809F6D